MMRWLWLAVLVHGCRSPAEPTQPMQTAQSTQSTPMAEAPSSPPATPIDEDIEWKLSATSTHLMMAQRSTWRLRVAATNRGSANAVVRSPTSEFTVNGVASMSLNMGFGNGALEPGWSSLSPGSTVSTEREIGESIFPSPGRFEIVLRRGDATSSLVVTVVP